jgi:hypothetical protein
MLITVPKLKYTNGTRDLRTPMATPLQPPRTRSGLNRHCAGIKISRVYHVISLGIYSLTRHEKTQNPGYDILNLGSRKFWKFSKTRSSINKWVARIYVCKILFQIPPTKSNFGNQTPY